MTEVIMDEQQKPSNETVTSEKLIIKNGDMKSVEEEKAATNEEEDSEEELGSLEKPVEILTNKRDRKTTERLSLDKFTPSKTSDEPDYTKGEGVKLGDIIFVRHGMEKVVAEKFKIMHRVLFRKQGKAVMIKKNIRSFCGFPFGKDSPYYEKHSNAIDKLLVANIKFILGILGLDKGGDRTALRDRLLEFLVKPVDHGKPIPGSKKKKEDKSKSKSKSKKKSKAKKSPKPQKDTKSSDTVSDDDDNNDVSSASDDSDNDEDEQKEKDKKEKSGTAAKPKKSPKKSPEKKETKEKKKKSPKKAPTAIKISMPKKKKDSPKKRKAADDSDDNEPLVKKTKNEPTDTQLRTVVSSILQDADLEKVTMKTVVKQVYEKFPEFDLTPRKEFIKNTVKEIIS